MQQKDWIAIARLSDVEADAAHIQESVRHPGNVGERPGRRARSRIAIMSSNDDRALSSRRRSNSHGFLPWLTFTQQKRSPEPPALP